jgi:hypothetical protein
MVALIDPGTSHWVLCHYGGGALVISPGVVLGYTGHLR